MPQTTFPGSIQWIILGIGSVMAAFCAAPVAAASGDISADFKMYYEQQIVGRDYQGPLGFLHDAAAAHIKAEQVLKAECDL